MDYSKIKEDFIKVIQHSQDISNPKVDNLFSTWYQKKHNIIQAFGNKLIYEVKKPISFELSKEAKEDRVQSFIDVCYDLGLDELSSFLANEREGFFTNKCEKDYQQVKKGTKLIKAFRFFIEDTKMLRHMQDRASQIIQENKVEGKLCFSVHPLDYLSISENNYNWRSCHALDGEYRAGNLSYMTDSSTIVCYLKGEENAKLPHFPDDVLWNSKKWRVLLYLSNDWKMIFAGKQYPFPTDDGMNMIVDNFFNYDKTNAYRKPTNRTRNLNSYRNSYWTHWTDYHLPRVTIDNILFDFNDDYIPVGNGMIGLCDLVKDGNSSQQFNDVLQSTCYQPMYSFLAEREWWGDGSRVFANYKSTRFEIGGDTYCLRCGEHEVMEKGSGTMMCYDCEEQYGTSDCSGFNTCICCGRRILEEDGYYVEDELYCDSCFDANAAKCECCGDYYLITNMTYNEDTDEYICSWCANRED